MLPPYSIIFLRQTFDCVTPYLDTSHSSHKIITKFLTEWPMLLSTCPQPPGRSRSRFHHTLWAQPKALLSSLNHTGASPVPIPVLLLFLQPVSPFLLSLPLKSWSPLNACLKCYLCHKYLPDLLSVPLHSREWASPLEGRG